MTLQQLGIRCVVLLENWALNLGGLYLIGVALRPIRERCLLAFTNGKRS